jgi:hypothetical protein
MKRVIPVTYLCLLFPLTLPAQEIPLMHHFLMNRDIVALAQAGYGEQTIIDTLLAKPNRFDTNADALVDLAAHGISERVVEAMMLAAACGQGCAQDMEKVRQAEAHAAEQQLPIAAKGVAYRTTLDIRADVRCPMADAALSLVSGKLPSGLRLTMDGLDGTPLETGHFRFTVRIRDGCTSRTRMFELEVTGKPILQASPDQIAFTAKVSGQKLAPRAFLVSSTWPNLPYHVEKQSADWLEVNLTSGRTPPADSALTADTVTLTADPSKLKPGTYRGALLVSTPGGANVQTIPVVLVVGGGE